MPRSMFGYDAFYHLVDNYEFNTVLDVGCGAGHHSRRFVEAGKDVTAIDSGAPASLFEHAINSSLEDYCKKRWIESNKKFDVLWCCHTLEHLLDVHSSLVMMRHMIKRGGYLCVTVPPLKHQIVGGHVSLWNGGLLLYRLVLAGFDCSEVWLRKYSYNISVIVQRGEKDVDINKMNGLKYDAGDIEKLAKYFPQGYNYQGFNGDIEEIG